MCEEKPPPDGKKLEKLGKPNSCECSCEDENIKDVKLNTGTTSVERKDLKKLNSKENEDFMPVLREAK